MKQFYKLTLAGVLTLALAFTIFPYAAAAQSERERERSSTSEEIKSPESGTIVWTGTAGLFIDSYYRYSTNPDEGLEKHHQTWLDLEFRRMRFLSPSWAAGLQGLGQLYMDGTFGNIGLGAIGVGPMVRFYPFQTKSSWQFYTQGGFLAGFNMALGDALGANAGEGFRLRTDLRAGATYRFSNSFGVYLETGPVWEADEEIRFDSHGWQLEVGIQLFRF